LALEAEISEGTVLRLERGTGVPRRITIRAIVWALESGGAEFIDRGVRLREKADLEAAE
jgi:hypothetical protein